MSLLPGLEAARSTHPAEASSEEGSLEEAAPSMPQDSGLGAHQALNSTDLDVPTEAVTCESQGLGVWGGKSNPDLLSEVQSLPWVWMQAGECRGGCPVGRVKSAGLYLSALEGAGRKVVGQEASLPLRERTGLLGGSTVQSIL